MDIERIEEYCLSRQTRDEISELLQKCFSDYPEGQIFYRQAPQFRLLAREKKSLVGHMGVEYRYIMADNNPFAIFGISDLCIQKDFRRRRVGASLIKELEVLGKKADVDFLVLVARDQGFYQKQGFISVPNRCRWVILTKGSTLGVAQRNLQDSLMIKPLGKTDWPDGIVDFMGHLF